MPNYCFNNLVIKGEEKDIKKFEKKAKGKETELSLNNFIPLPEELENTTSPSMPKTKAEKTRSAKLIKKYGFDNWYDWKVANWGTKWDITAYLDLRKKGRIEYHFDSAWSPPNNAIIKIGIKYPELDFELNYEEPGMCFKGELRISGGNVIEDNCYDYNPENEEEDYN